MTTDNQNKQWFSICGLIRIDHISLGENFSLLSDGKLCLLVKEVIFMTSRKDISFQDASKRHLEK